MPALHQGYLDFFARHEDADVLYLVGDELLYRHDHITRKDIRRVSAELMREAVLPLGFIDKVEVLDEATISSIAADVEVVMPDEEITRDLANNFLNDHKITWDKVFLRWHRDNSAENQPMTPDEEISQDQFDKEVMAIAEKEGEKSLDWYRQIGAALVKDGEVVLTAHNQHAICPNGQCVVGDPRSNFKRGVNADLSAFIHAEASIIAEAASKGLALEGTALYVSHFPCPSCAKIVAKSGIKTLYYAQGYAMLDGLEVLKTHGVKTVFVK